MILSVNKVSFRYNGRPVLQDIDFELPPGQILGVLGVNGAGKSTLLKCINNILKPRSGTVLLEGRNLFRLNRTAIAQKIGYVPQKHHDENMSVFDSVLLGRKPHISWSASEGDLLKVEKLISLMGLQDLALRPVSSLSGGEAQKVLIARALAQEPSVLLLDEPTSNLDLRNQLEVMSIIEKVVKSKNMSAVIAIHDLNLALRFADLLLVLKNGSIRTIGPKDTITPDIIEEVYGVHSIIQHVEGYPVVIPVNCCKPISSHGVH